MTLNEFYGTVYRRFAVFVSAYDADSIRFDLDLGDYLKFENRSVRVYGIDAPEKAPHKAGRTPESLVEEKSAALEALARALAYIQAAEATIVVQTIKRPGKKLYDKYGRVLGRIWIPVGGMMLDLSERLLAEKHAKPYFGGKKPAWQVMRPLGQADPSPLEIVKTLSASAGPTGIL